MKLFGSCTCTTLGVATTSCSSIARSRDCSHTAIVPIAPLLCNSHGWQRVTLLADQGQNPKHPQCTFHEDCTIINTSTTNILAHSPMVCHVLACDSPLTLAPMHAGARTCLKSKSPKALERSSIALIRPSNVTQPPACSSIGRQRILMTYTQPLQHGSVTADNLCCTPSLIPPACNLGRE